MSDHADVPHYDCPTPAKQKFYDALDADEEYCKLVRREKWEERCLQDLYRVLGRSVYEVFENNMAIRPESYIEYSEEVRRHLESVKKHRKLRKEARTKKWNKWDEIKLRFGY